MEHVPYIIKEDKNFLGDTALMTAVLNGNLETVRYLVEDVLVDINSRDNQGYTPLVAACANEFLEIVVYLLCIKKADPQIKGYNKQGAAHRAAYYNNISTLKLLRRYSQKTTF